MRSQVRRQAAERNDLFLVTLHRKEDAATAPRSHLSLGGVLVFVALGLSALWLWAQGAETRAIQRLPNQERRALYERTFRTLQETCNPEHEPAALAGYCREQAEFVVRFPECDETCLALARAHLVNPSK